MAFVATVGVPGQPGRVDTVRLELASTPSAQRPYASPAEEDQAGVERPAVGYLLVIAGGGLFVLGTTVVRGGVPEGGPDGPVAAVLAGAFVALPGLMMTIIGIVNLIAGDDMSDEPVRE